MILVVIMASAFIGEIAKAIFFRVNLFVYNGIEFSECGEQN
jgi:hypothetical protein